MKFRKFFLGSRLWIRAAIARRRSSRLKILLKEKEALFEKEKQSLIKHYEYQLALERTKNETLHIAWADRWLQREKLATLSISTGLIAEKAAAKLPPSLENQVLEDELSYNQNLELQDRKNIFWGDGLTLNRSLPEINSRWEQLKPDIMNDIRLTIT